jgi:polar amino acid transport system substrate-binding protein
LYNTVYTKFYAVNKNQVVINLIFCYHSGSLFFKKSIMSKLKIVLVVIVVIAVVLVCWLVWDQPNQSNNKNSQDTVFIASGHPEWAPIMWQQGDKIIGVGPDLVTKIFTDLGVRIESKYTGLWDEVQAQAKSGSVDVLVAAYKTTERETYMDYSDAYTVDPIALFVSQDRGLAYNAWEDLVGKRVVAMVGDSYGQEFDGFMAQKLTVERVKTATEAFQMLKDGQADYFVYALYAGEKFIGENQLADKIAVLPKYVAAENFYITISKQSPLIQYLPRINEIIAQYKADGTIDRLIAQNKKLMLGSLADQ